MHKPLTIAVDIRDLRLAKTGTRTYLEELCREFKKMESAELRFHFLDTSLPVYNGQNKLLRYVEHARYQFWKQLILPIKAFFRRCDIVFCTDNCVPVMHLGYQTIPVFHDAFCFESPEAYGKLWLWLYMKTAVPAASRSRFVITPTEWSKKQIHHYTQIPNDKLEVIYEGPKYLNADEAANGDTMLDKFSLKPQGYILHVGSMFKRKNIPALIEAFAIAKQTSPTLKLVLAGPKPANEFDSDYRLIRDAIKKNNLSDEVVLTGYLSDSELAVIYQNALLYVFPSTNEGFGIPVLEAFKNNLPVLVANNTCLPEVGGDAVLQFDPFNVSDIADKINLVANDPELRSRMIDKGRQRLKLFSWQNTATQLINVFKKAAMPRQIP
ncbi:glycosyltransferase family 1 protein [Mucilaginibacter sp. L3T2-6]|uniref:glycosyltransferase family 4 protein n=1 Tax=Mucilaginibacter sp. L3T2-6 TaxID=3062491 RepID=UPI002674A4F2|nr:glycosyltransferase family 1 protein [Mucilaginibacter sp. L3T2-6]MDO3642696.1 glycosyltransferase family 1 protein [Mucilaginibacter sp. L3T2-6]MDV6215345.1 glycosyltransferase family 1 protein [Mucilaginibacter sp. L3T2-6]